MCLLKKDAFIISQFDEDCKRFGKNLYKSKVLWYNMVNLMKKGESMRIITLTLSPAYDVHCYAEEFEAFCENLATVTARDAGGKGVNISRALSKNGISNTAVVVLGEENGADFAQALNQDGLSWISVPVSGRIRENLTLHTQGKPETCISFRGFKADVSLLDRVSDAIGDVDGETVITFTGRVPDGMDLPHVKTFLADLRAKGAKIVIDSKAFSISDLAECRPWLIKPNEEELAAYLGKHDVEMTDVRAFCMAMRSVGIDNVMVSLGEKGACLACADGFFKAVPPPIQPLSSIGAGDSAIAGFLAEIVNGKTPAQCLQSAVAFGSAACLTAGTKPPRAEDVQTLRGQVELVFEGENTAS